MARLVLFLVPLLAACGVSDTEPCKDAPYGTVCRASAGGCDIAETCDGVSPTCPADAFMPTDTVCRQAVGGCDVAETCSGSDAACPDDGWQPAFTICRPAAGQCDLGESCTGDGPSCPSDAYAPAGRVCRAASGDCDLAETCSGSSVACPTDRFAGSSTVCRAAAGACDAPERCDGACNVAEHCAGALTCPDDDGAVAPDAPTLVSAVVGAASDATSATVEWGAVTFVGAAQYEVEYGTDETFATGVSSSGFQSATSFAVPLTSGASVYFRVTARDASLTTCTTATSEVGEARRNTVPEPPTGLQSTETQSPNGSEQPYWAYDLSWTASVDADGDDLEYEVEVQGDLAGCTAPYDFESATSFVAADSGWISATTFSAEDLPSSFSDPAATCLGVRVRARDRFGESDWATLDSVLGSCPFLFVWTGSGYAFESDLYPAGRLATVRQGAYARPNPDDGYLLANTPAAVDGAYVLQITSERDEVDYTDQIAMYAVYAPAGLDVYAEKGAFGSAAFDPEEGLHTVEALEPPLQAIHVDTGDDVTDALSAMDGVGLVFNDDPNHAVRHTIELDLGDLSSAPRIKLILDGRSQFPTTVAGSLWSGQQGAPTRIQVPDADGEWVTASGVVLSPPTGFRRPVLLDLTDAFPTDDYRVRLSFGFRTLIDATLVDTSEDAPIELVELPLRSADLHERGISGTTGGDWYDLVYDDVRPSSLLALPGAYTRLGDVTALLDAIDDQDVITAPGDELTVRFDEAPAPGTDEDVRLLLVTHGYYKDRRTDLEPAVEPLPFAAMSNYPYPSSEHYPDDAEHDAYRATWNTRVLP